MVVETRIRFEEAAQAGELAGIVDAAAKTEAGHRQQKPCAGRRWKELLENPLDSGSVALPCRLLARRLGIGYIHGWPFNRIGEGAHHDCDG
jgi:hypothetical protein